MSSDYSIKVDGNQVTITHWGGEQSYTAAGLNEAIVQEQQWLVALYEAREKLTGELGIVIGMNKEERIDKP